MSHEHVVAGHRDQKWDHCVVQDCQRPYTHGNRWRIEYCTCGAERHSEISEGRVNSDRWADEPDED